MMIYKKTSAQTIFRKITIGQFINTVFQSSSILAYTPTDHDALFGEDHIKYYCTHDGICASVIRHLRLHGSLNDSIINDMIYVISTS